MHDITKLRISILYIQNLPCTVNRIFAFPWFLLFLHPIGSSSYVPTTLYIHICNPPPGPLLHPPELQFLLNLYANECGVEDPSGSTVWPKPQKRKKKNPHLVSTKSTQSQPKAPYPERVPRSERLRRPRSFFWWGQPPNGHGWGRFFWCRYFHQLQRDISYLIIQQLTKIKRLHP